MYKDKRTKKQHRVRWQKWYNTNREYYKAKRKKYWYAYQIIILERQEEIAGRKRPTKCEICNKKGRICFDHCHKTGKFRGWVCSSCNLALGNVKDSTEVLKALIKYLNKHRRK